MGKTLSRTTDRIRVLHVDDEPEFAGLAATFLEREDSQLTVETVTSASDGLDRFTETAFDCIISDHDMPGQNGIEFLKAIRNESPDLPFILFTGKGSEEIASEAISAGVTDYLQKGSGTDQYTVLANRVRNAVEQFRSKQALTERNRELRRYKQMINSMHEAACIYNSEGRFELVNEYLAEWYNATPEDLEGKQSTLIPQIREHADGDPYHELLVGERREIRGELDGDFPGHGYAVLEYRLTPLRVDGTIEGVVSIARDITDRRERQAELERKDRAMDAAPVGITISDPSQDDNPLSYVNDRFTEITGYTEEDALGSNCRFLQGEHTSPEPVVRMREAIDNEEPVTVELRNYRQDGTEFWNRVSIAPVYGDDSEVTHYVGFQQDVTVEKEREQEYERTVDLLNQTEQIADVGGWEIDPETEAVFWTDHLFEMLGVEYGEEPPLDEALDVYLEADRPRVENAVNEAIAAGEPFDVEARFQRPDGEIREFRILGEPTIENGDVVTLRGAVHDITASKEREKELTQAREEYEALFNGMNDAAWVINTDTEFLAVNDVAVRRTGYTREELLSMRPHDIDGGLDNDDITALIEGMPEDEIQVFETKRVTKDGEQIPVEISSSLVTYKGETAILSIGRDISDRKQREKQLEQFASIVSHDLRNPLNVAEGRLELAREECDSEHLDDIARAHERMDALIDDLLTLAREGETVGDTERIDLARLTEICWANVATAEATLVMDIDRRIQADRSRLQQLLENLMRNAVEHGGENLTVTLGTVADGFYVEDNGPGIPEDERDDVFKAGYSTTEDGTGFGLSIVKQVAQAHGWDIGVTDGPDGGARFEITGLKWTDT
ncbi:PAS domain S-box protein [Halopenitus sp. POP-27]|uniref:PAS domain S-box protein n=1 Tax=Halopenitus sp. POP-27 TaxID=2994425 RepID=UPI002468245D|nr:PAS domain S-box protein [Halopenitus sp. POP-27]